MNSYQEWDLTRKDTKISNHQTLSVHFYSILNFDNFLFSEQILREALSSKSNFKRHYFELAELAMGTFKHMGRYRAARNIGAQLSEFYRSVLNCVQITFVG